MSHRLLEPLDILLEGLAGALHRVNLQRPLEQRNRFIIEPPAFVANAIAAIAERIAQRTNVLMGQTS